MPSQVFDEIFIKQLAVSISSELSQKTKATPHRWPELMTIDTAAEYMDRTPNAIKHLVAAKLLPVCRIDGRSQIRRLDLDRLIERKTA